MSLFGNASLFGNKTQNGNNNGQQTSGIFGNNSQSSNFFSNTSNNQGGNSLFGNNTSNNQGGNSLFGNNTSNNQGGLFGNTSNNNQQQTGLFGNISNNNQQQTGLFGNTSNNNQQQTGLFGNTSNNNQQQTGLFGNINNNNQQQTGLFGNTSNNNQQQTGKFENAGSNPANWSFGNNNFNNNQNNINQIPQINNYTIFTSQIPVIALNPNNRLKDIQLRKLPPNYQDKVYNLKLNLKNQEIQLVELLQYHQRLNDLIDKNNQSVQKLGEFNGFINQKLGKFEQITNQAKDNFNVIFESFEEEQKNIKLMEEDSGYKIEIPSKFLLNYSRNLLNRTELFQQRLNDIITLIKVYNSKSNKDYIFDSDIIESTIAEFIKIVRYLLESNERQEKMINEMLHYFLEISREKGYNPETVYKNIMQYHVENNSNYI